MIVTATPRRTTDTLGVFTISITLSIPLGKAVSRTKHVALASWRNVTKEECYVLRDRFFQSNDEYNFKEGIVTAKWQVVEYL
jgi:hypothetical protein